jgi:hypothetical protein
MQIVKPHSMSPINTEHDEQREILLKPLWTVEIQEVEADTCTIFGIIYNYTCRNNTGVY